MFLQNRASFLGRPALDRRQWPVAPNSHPVDRRPFVGRNSASASRSPPRRSASSMSRFWSSPFSSRGCPGTALRALLAADRWRLWWKWSVRVGRPSRAAFPVAGAKADAGWNGFLGPLGRARSAAETRAAQRSSLPLSIGAEEHTQRSAWDFAISQCFLPSLCCRLQVASLTQERFQRSVIGLSGVKMTTRAKLKSQNPPSLVLSAGVNLKAERDRQLFGR